MSTVRIIAIVCTAQVFAQIGAFAVPALLPTFIDRWDLSGTEAGWIIGAFYLRYTATVPVLVSLTDRIDPKRIYLGAVLLTTVAALGYATLADGFWSAFVFRLIAGASWRDDPWGDASSRLLPRTTALTHHPRTSTVDRAPIPK